jgi:hypothetical protein
MEAARHGGNEEKARAEYETMMGQAFRQAHRVLKAGAPLICVYAHKTTAGWATLIDAMRTAGFVVTEAWPIDTENPSRQRSKDSSALRRSRHGSGVSKAAVFGMRPPLRSARKGMKPAQPSTLIIRSRSHDLRAQAHKCVHC